MGGPDDKSPLPDFSGSSPRGHQGRRGSLLGEHEIVGDIRMDLGMSGRFHPSGGTTTAKATLRLRHY